MLRVVEAENQIYLITIINDRTRACPRSLSARHTALHEARHHHGPGKVEASPPAKGTQ